MLYFLSFSSTEVLSAVVDSDCLLVVATISIEDEEGSTSLVTVGRGDVSFVTEVLTG